MNLIRRIIKRLTIRRRALYRGYGIMDGRGGFLWMQTKTNWEQRNLIRLNRIRNGVKPFSPCGLCRWVGEVWECDFAMESFGNAVAR